MSSTKAAVNSFDECNVFEKAAQLSVIVCDNKLYDSNDEAFSMNTVCNCRSRLEKFFILIALAHMVFVFVIVSPAEYQRKEFNYFEEILEAKTFTANLHQKKHTECIFLQIKLVRKYMHMESDVRIKEQRNIPLVQLGENIESLTITGY